MNKISIAILGAICFTAIIAGGSVLANDKEPVKVRAYDIHLNKKIVLNESEAKALNSKAAKGKPGGTSAATATGVLGQSLPEGGQRYAIVVGICNYPGANYLCASDGDSYYFRKALIDKYGFAPENIYWFKDRGVDFTEPGTGSIIKTIAPTFGNIANQIAALTAAAGENDEIVVFFSGHGGDGIAADGDSEKRDEGIVVFADNTLTGLDYIWDGELRQWFNGETARMLFVFDSCLAGGMNDVAAQNRIVAMATSETSSAYVYSKTNADGVGEGVFSHYFSRLGMLEQTAEKYSELPGQTIITVEEAFDYAKPLSQAYSPRQVPVASDKFLNDLGL